MVEQKEEISKKIREITNQINQIQNDPLRLAQLYEQRAKLHERNLENNEYASWDFSAALENSIKDFEKANKLYAQNGFEVKVPEIDKEISELKNLSYNSKLKYKETPLPKVALLSQEISRLESQLKKVDHSKVENDEQEIARLKNKLTLNATLGANYEKMGDLAETNYSANYILGVTHFANAAMDAHLLGKDKQASEHYRKAAKLSKKLGEEEKVKYFTQRSKEARRRTLKSSLDSKIRGEFILAAFALSLFFASPSITGNVVGAAATDSNLLGLIPLCFGLILLALKLFSRTP